MDPKKAITERTEAAARDLYGARPAERLRPVGYMQIETRETWKQLGRGAMSFLIGVLLASEPSFFCKLCREEGCRHSSDGTQLEEDAELSRTLTLIRLFNALQDVPVLGGEGEDETFALDTVISGFIGPWRDSTGCCASSGRT